MPGPVLAQKAQQDKMASADPLCFQEAVDLERPLGQAQASHGAVQSQVGTKPPGSGSHQWEPGAEIQPLEGT